ncbi:MAG: hypothetical protein P8Z37_18760, partial [Acidobacteriota bacterium]
MYKTSRIFCVFLFLIPAAVSGCHKTVHQVDPSRFENVIAAYTSGMISRESPIRIRFVDEVADAARFNVAMKRSPFSFDPDIDGVTLWSDGHTLEFRPEERLPDGVSYKANLDLSEILAVDPDKENFVFEFSTIQQTFEVSIKGLESVVGRGQEVQQLSGELLTADVENGSEIGKILTAFQKGKRLDISWFHHNNKREHSFTVEGIVRGDAAS